jgi:hypothetical protein
MADGEKAFVMEDYLAGVLTISRQVPPETNLFPAIGIEYQGGTNEPLGMIAPTGSYQRTAKFEIVVAVSMPFSPTQADTVTAARLALRQYVDDGNGNGLGPLLLSDPTLGGLAQMSWWKSLLYSWASSKSASAGIIAYAQYQFTAQYRVP